MTTGGFENWGGDITQIGALYPFPGSELIFFVLGVAFWIGWHFLQFSEESVEYSEATRNIHENKDRIRHFIEK